MLAVNFDVYATAGRALLAGEPLYATHPPDHPNYFYLYPPIVAVAFVPYALLGGGPVAFATHTAVQAIAALGLAALTIRFVERRGVEVGWLDRLLVAGFLLVGIHSVYSVYYGNVNVLLAALIGVGFVGIERDRQGWAGAAFGLAALIKAFPAALGIWFLRRRAWRAVGAAVAVGAGGLLVGLALGPETTVAYVTDALLPRFGSSAVNGEVSSPYAPYVTARKPFLALGADRTVAAVGAAAVVAPVVAYCYRDCSTPVARLRAAFATVAGVLLVFPSYFVYVVLVAFPLVGLAYLETGRARWLVLAGAMVANFSYALGSVRAAVQSAPLPPGVESTVLSAAGALLSVASLPGYGIAIVLAGCVLGTRASLVAESTTSE